MLRTLLHRACGLHNASPKRDAYRHYCKFLRGGISRVRYLHSGIFQSNSRGQYPKYSIQLRQFSSAEDYPEHTVVKLPSLSPTMETGSIVTWNVKEGDKVNEGDVLAETETDKATMAIESPDEGYVAKLLQEKGAKDIKVGTPILILTPNKENVERFKNYVYTPEIVSVDSVGKSPSKAEISKPTQPSSEVPKEPASQPGTKERPRASPLAQKIAEQRQIRLEGKGTGLFNSIKSTDLDKLAEKKSIPTSPVSVEPTKQQAMIATKPGQTYADIPLTNIRKTIASRLLQSKQTIPHYYLSMEIAVMEIEKTRKVLNAELGPLGYKITVNDFIIKAMAMASRKVPEVNAIWMDTFIRQYDQVDVSVAVSTPSGLITPIVFGADVKSVKEISQDVKSLASKARSGKLQPHEFQGGTITVSNLGMFGINQFCAVINPPQSCILAVGTTTKKVILAKKKSGTVPMEVPVMMVTLSADHRVIDGALAAIWLTAFKDFMQTPGLMYA